MSHPAITHEYRCPGETYTISRSVHLARLAAYYPKCASCSHRSELGAWEPPPIPLPIVDHPGKVPAAKSNHDSTSHGVVFTDEGIRGTYLNTLSRSTAGELTAAFAYCIWERIQTESIRPDRTILESHSDVAATGNRIRLGPSVVIAHDERPSSPDIVMGVGAMLRRLGCRLIDVGLATRPEFAFAVQHLQGDGGVYITGAGCDPAWSGLEFTGRDGAPWSNGGSLDRVRSRFMTGVARPSRKPGSQRLFSVAQAYEAGLQKHWHALRPLQIACALPGRRVREMFERLFHQLSCRLIHVPTPVRGRTLSDPNDPDLARTATAVRSGRAHLGFLVSEEGDACAFFDERGTLISSDRMLAIFARELLEQRANLTVICEGEPGDLTHLARVRPVPSSPTREAVWDAWDHHRADLAGGSSGRYWFDAPGAVCDAVVTTAHLLQALSRDDTPFSELNS